MARLTDNQGRLLGGLDGLRFRQAPTLERSAVAAPARVMTRTPLAAQYGPEETVPGLGCSYGALVYSRAARHRNACHNPIETPDERHHCDLCSGDYCSVHAEPAAHDCMFVAEPD
jgi:hypothetical protein